MLQPIDRTTGQADCRTGLPDTCSAACSEVFLPFYSSCGGFVWSAEEAGGQAGPHTHFAEQCAVVAGITATDTQCQGRGCDDCNGDCGWCVGPYWLFHLSNLKQSMLEQYGLNPLGRGCGAQVLRAGRKRALLVHMQHHPGRVRGSDGPRWAGFWRDRRPRRRGALTNRTTDL